MTKPRELEADFASWFEGWLKICHHLYYHTFNSEHSAAGYPDYTIIARKRPDKPSRLVFAELKAEDGKLSPAQLLWVAALELAGEEVHIFRPSDRDKIQRVLA